MIKILKEINEIIKKDNIQKHINKCYLRRNLSCIKELNLDSSKIIQSYLFFK